ncbi:MAG: ATP-binding protein [Eubacteriales bacterium]
MIKEKVALIIEKIDFIRSLKIRLWLLFLVVGMMPAFLIQNIMVNHYMSKQIEVEIQDMQNQMNILANHLVQYYYLLDASSEVVNAELEQLATLYDGRVLIVNNSFKIIKDTYGMKQNNYIVSSKVLNCFSSGTTAAEYDKENQYIEMVTPIYDHDEVVGVILISFSTSSFEVTREIVGRQGDILLSLNFILLTAVAFLLANVLVLPFIKLRTSVQKMALGSEERISVEHGYLETEYIVEEFNEVLTRNRILDESRQEFVSNVSHELKTPITSVKVLADSLIAQGEVPNELYREFMVDIAAEIEREDKIINDLLSLVKLDKKVETLNIEPIFIEQLLELILKRLRPIAQLNNIELILESMRDVIAEVDEVKLTLALTNIIENAIKYNKKNGQVVVTLDADHQVAMIQVKDTGLGIPAEAIDHIYERFYRVDKSHSREIGGTGLGLAITKSAIQMHKGSLQVESQEGVGTTFIIKIPLSYIVE